MKIGVIGIGVVGYPLMKALQYYHKKVYCFDLNKKESDDWSDIIKTDIVFVCVPTNTKKDHRLDMSIVDETCRRLCNDSYKGIVVIKSTLGLGYIRELIESVDYTIVVFPEWLRAVSSFPDTLSPEMIVIGSDLVYDAKKVLEVCCWHKIEHTHFVKPEEAVMIKLAANALASTKISFANQIQLICEKYNTDVDKVMNVIQKDPRCSPRYLKSGKPFGGACLPKDLSELCFSMDCKDNNLLLGVLMINRKMEEKNYD